MRHLDRFIVGLTLLLGAAGGGWSLPLFALEPPTPQELARYRSEGSLARHIAAARALGNDRIAPELMARVSARLKAGAKNGPGQNGEVGPQSLPPGQKAMPGHGVVNVLALLIAFPEYAPFSTAGFIQDRLFGQGSGQYPNISLRTFYQRSSYNQLDIQGQALGWYTTAYARSAVAQTNEGREGLIKEALQFYEAQGFDFSPYDNDGDGVIDYLVVIWTGPHQDWADFWWGYQTSFLDTNFTVEGKRLRLYSWQWESRNYPAEFTPGTVTHETGHALGLPDYYDYDASVGPKDGLGGLDQMDSYGDHNCFSKFMLEWLTPTFIASSSQRLTLRPSGNFPDVVLVMPEVTPANPFAEYYLIQNRWRAGNDLTFPNDGLLIWHVDARLDDWHHLFQYNNSYTEHKLIRLMEADGLEEIEQGRRANAGDFYTPGKSFGTTTVPSSNRYDGTQTGITIVNITYADTSISFDLTNTFIDTTPPTGAPAKPVVEQKIVQTPVLDITWSNGTAGDPESGIVGYFLEIRTIPNQETVFTDYVGNTTQKLFHNMVDGETYQARVRAVNGAGLAGAWSELSNPITVAMPPICEAVDHCGLEWTSGGLSPWFAQSAVVSPRGGSAAQNGLIPDSSESRLQTTVEGPGHLSFYWKVSSEEGYDSLIYLLDHNKVEEISGEVDWQHRTFDLPAGPHILEWTYRKDEASKGGADAGWLDGVVYYRLKGDLDLSGRVDALDLVVMAHYRAGNLSVGTTPFLASLEAADLDNSGTIDNTDLAKLIMLLADATVAGQPPSPGSPR